MMNADPSGDHDDDDDVLTLPSYASKMWAASAVETPIVKLENLLDFSIPPSKQSMSGMRWKQIVDVDEPDSFHDIVTVDYRSATDASVPMSETFDLPESVMISTDNKSVDVWSYDAMSMNKDSVGSTAYDAISRDIEHASALAGKAAQSIVDGKSCGTSTITSQYIPSIHRGDSKRVSNEALERDKSRSGSRQRKFVVPLLLIGIMLFVVAAGLVGTACATGKCRGAKSSASSSSNTLPSLQDNADQNTTITTESRSDSTPTTIPVSTDEPFLAVEQSRTTSPIFYLLLPEEPTATPTIAPSSIPSTEPVNVSTTVTGVMLSPTYSPESTMPTIVPTPLPLPLAAIRINVGGDTFTDSEGIRWQADNISFGKDYGVDCIPNSTIANTFDDILYCSSRWFSPVNSPGMSGVYNIEIPVEQDGQYSISLHFAKLFFTTTASRTFDVKVEESLIANDLDIVSAAGGARAAFILQTIQPILDGFVTITLISKIDNAAISAIEVEYVGPYAPMTDTPITNPTVTPTGNPTVFPTTLSPSNQPMILSISQTPTNWKDEGNDTLVLVSNQALRSAVDLYLNGANLSIPINAWDVSRITNFSRLFSKNRNPLAVNFDEDLDQWDVSRATSMFQMFYGATNFDRNLCSWGSKLSNATNGQYMLRNDLNLSHMFTETGCTYDWSPDAPSGPWCGQDCLRRERQLQM